MWDILSCEVRQVKVPATDIVRIIHRPETF